MTTAGDLISRGYFPKELPPAFTTETFGTLVAELDEVQLDALLPDRATAVSAHNLARPGTLRRRLGIPNPFSELALCRSLSDNWDELESHFNTSGMGKSTPRVGEPGERALERKVLDLSELSLQVRSRGAFLATADITRCYESIYTHSVAWALHSKKTAKLRRWDVALLGNAIDRLCRMRQDDQTMGIPIGPDSSLAVSEIVLSAIDLALEDRLPSGVRASRWVDDYEFGCGTRSEAETALATLSEVLAKFELSLNPAKTVILELPSPIGQLWTRDLRLAHIRERTWRGERADLIDYFDLAFRLVHANKQGAVLSYAISRLSPLRVFTDNWPLFHDLLWQCIVAEPGTIPWALDQFIDQKDFYFEEETANNILSNLVVRNAAQRHTSEVTWAIWAAIVLGVSLSSAAAESVSAWEDPTVAILALDAEQRGLFESRLDTSLWRQSLSEESLDSAAWLLAYEPTVKGWLTGATDHVGGHPRFSALRANAVEFYDSDLALAINPTGKLTRSVGGLGPYG